MEAGASPPSNEHSATRAQGSAKAPMNELASRTDHADRSGGHRGLMALRALALFEAAKGVSALLLAVASWIWLGHDGPVTLIGDVFRWLHLDPAGSLMRRLNQAVTALPVMTPLPLTLAALFYAAARLAEAWGLWRSRPWASWLAIASSAAFVPVELEALFKHPSLWTALILVVNLAVIGWLWRHAQNMR